MFDPKEIKAFKAVGDDISPVVYDEEIESDIDETEQDHGGESGE